MLIAKSNSCPQCGPGHSNECFVTYENGSYCFSCGLSTFNKADYSYKPKVIMESTCYVPENITNDWNKLSLEVQEWLLTNYINKDIFKKYQIGYVPFDKFTLKSGREVYGDSLIMPTIVSNTVVFYQRRFFPKKQLLSVGDSKAIFVAGEGDTVVLTEDYFSAVRVAESGKTIAAIPLLGTTLKPHIIDYIVRYYSHIVLWLDDDEPGIEGAKKGEATIIKRLSKEAKTWSYAYKQYQVSILTETEAKRLTNAKINAILSTLTT